MPSAVPPLEMVRRLLLTAGYRTDRVPEGWRAQRPTDHRVLLLYPGPTVPAGFQQGFPEDAQERIVLVQEPLSEGERERVELAGSQVVEGAEITGALGRWLLPPRAQDAFSEEQAGREGLSDATPTQLRLRAGPADAPRHPEDPLPYPPQVFPQERIVRARLSLEDARELVRGRIAGGRALLVLIPFYLYAYRLRGELGPPGAVLHLVAVPATAGVPVFWEGGRREVVPEVHQPHRRLAALVGPDEARPRALSAICRYHATPADSSEQRGGILVIERSQAPLAPERVLLGTTPVQVLAPYWVLEASSGRLVLDAVTGEAVGPEVLGAVERGAPGAEAGF